MEWNPVETAPFVQEVLVTDGDYVWMACRIDDLVAPGFRMTQWYFLDDVISVKPRNPPTHWRPLPEPPHPLTTTEGQRQ